MLSHLIAASAFALFSSSAFADPVVIGRASVIDGDTIEIDSERIRLDGIDSPESRQACNDAAGQSYRCGKTAADALDAFLAASRPTRCQSKDRDRYGRLVAVCFRADGQEVNAWLVRSGHALDWPRYSKGRYAADQDAAENSGLSIWAGSFELPCEWRAAKSGRKPSC